MEFPRNQAGALSVPAGRSGGQVHPPGWLAAPLQPAGRRRWSALELRRPAPLGASPQAPFSQQRARRCWALGARGSAAAGICCAPAAWPRSSAGGRTSRPRTPGSRRPPSPCAGRGPTAACRAGTQLSWRPTAGCSRSRRRGSIRRRRLRCGSRPGRWSTGCLPLPPTALPAAAGWRRPSRQSRSAPEPPQHPRPCPAKRDVQSA